MQFKRRLALSSPLSISGCQLLLDARFRNSLFTNTTELVQATDGVQVGRWKDLSENNRHCDTASSVNKPTLKVTSDQLINNLPGVYFDGVNRKLVSPSFDVSNPYTICVVVGNVISGYFIDGNVGNTRIIGYNDITHSFVYESAFILSSVSNWSTGTFLLGTYTGDATAITRAQAIETVGDAGAATETSGVSIGGFGADFTSAPLAGTIGFVGMWNRVLSQSERDFLYHYCTQAWGIDVSK